MNSKITLHHVGGRGGTLPFPAVPRFESDFVSVLYDADKACVPHIKSVQKNRSEAHIFPYCLGKKNGIGTLHINYDTPASSLLPFHTDKSEWYFYFRKSGLDNILGENMESMKRERVHIVTLDTLLVKNKEIPPPDFFSLDTQGTEYDILQGAKKTLRTHVLAVVAEVSFHELYKKQKLFGAVTALLARQGFSFVKFTKYILECAPYRYPIGLRDEGFYTATDALYLRDIHSIRSVRDKTMRTHMFEKLAFIALVFHQFEYALRCLDEMKLIRTPSHSPQYAYQEFLEKLHRTARRIPRKYPPTFKERFSFRESAARYKQGARTQDISEPIIDISAIKQTHDSPIEALLREYGLIAHADAVKKNRLLCR